MTNGVKSHLPPYLYASASLAFALMGDAFLYSFLPVNASSVLLSGTWIGVVLSVNRFIRILFNPVIVYVFSRLGFRIPTIVATCLAVLTTGGYGLGLNVGDWILLRMLWGLSYSVLRISVLTYALDFPRKGFALGLSQSLTEAGPLLALLIGPFFLERTSPSVTFLLLACLSVPGIYFACQLPERAHPVPYRLSVKLRFPTTFNSLAFVSAFSVEGMLIVLVGILLQQTQPGWTSVEITAIAAGFLSFRRVCSLLVSPLTGWLADQFGLIPVFSGSVLLVGTGLLLLSTGFVLAGLIVVLTVYNIQSALSAGSSAEGETDATQAVSLNTAFRDAGAAFGALAAGFLLTFPRLDLLFMGSSFTIGLLLLLYWRHTRVAIKDSQLP